jgi:frataxin-like iron-binding protein CyaY
MMKTINLWAHFAVETKCAQRFMVFIMNMSIITECQCLNCKMCSKINGLHHDYVDHYWISVSQLQNVLKDSWSLGTYLRWRPWIFEHISQLRHWDSVMIDIFMMKTMNLWAHFVVETLTVFIMNMSIITECQCLNCKMCSKIHGLHHEYVDHYWMSVSMMKTMNLWAHFAVETLTFSNDRHIHDEDHESLSTFCSWDTEIQ